MSKRLPGNIYPAHQQLDFDVRFDWGGHGVDALADCNVFVIVDVLSFSTCVDIACARRARIFPWAGDLDAAAEHASRHAAQLASRTRTSNQPSLSPTSLVRLPSGARLVLPSPNGSTLSQQAQRHGAVVAACLRNARAVAKALDNGRGPIAVIAAAERWPDQSLRPALEDLLGAGAVINALAGSRSPEAQQAASAFRSTRVNLAQTIAASASGRELIDRGFADDVALASQLCVSGCVPELIGEAFVNSSLQ